jgi:hypothetical protein
MKSPDSISKSVRPASLLRKSIQDLKPAGICDGWLHRNIQVACHPVGYKTCCYFNELGWNDGTFRLVSPPISSKQPKN